MRYRAITASGTAPVISSFTKRCCTACDQPALLAVRRVSVKRSGMTLVPVYPFDCQDSGSARAFHECARIAADLAHKALAPFSSQFGTGRMRGTDRRYGAGGETSYLGVKR